MYEQWLKPSLQEWLETDGLGGFSSSTTCGIHTRRYHGWLFLSGKDPNERWLALSKLEDWCTSPDGKWALSSNFYPGTTYPNGIDNLWAFSKNPFPKFIFKIGKQILEREIFMVKGVPGVFCVYRLENSLQTPGKRKLTLTLRPLCNNRFYHHAAREGSWDPQICPLEGAVILESHPACDKLLFVCHKSRFVEDPKWYKNMLYPKERERGLEYLEDHFSPGYFSAELASGEEVVFWAGPSSKDKSNFGRNFNSILNDVTFDDFVKSLAECAKVLRDYELNRRKTLVKDTRSSDLLARLILAGDQFIIRTEGKTSIVAGYHWFGEWGRDTFISLPGLLLSTGRFREAKEVFLRFAEAIRKGVIPNRFEGGRGAAYNSVDASLWFIDALAKYERETKDWNFVQTVLPRVTEIVNCYIRGTNYDIKMDSDCLLKVGSKDVQLTWMDACVNGIPVTPRHGYPVEVNALWIQALSYVGQWFRRLDEAVGKNNPANYKDYLRLARAARKEFLKRFIWPQVGLYDRLDEKGPVLEIRPNQVIAAAIEGMDLPSQVLVEVWNTAYTKLLTPHGLRTLAPFSPGYTGKYRGGPQERDSAYHQGTAWPWLLGPFFDLARKIWKTAGTCYGNHGYCGDRDQSNSHLEIFGEGVNENLDADMDKNMGNSLFALFPVLLSHIVRLDSNPCIGTIFEVASGDPPYEPGGAVAQAWSVAETTRILKSLSVHKYR